MCKDCLKSKELSTLLDEFLNEDEKLDSYQRFASVFDKVVFTQNMSSSRKKILTALLRPLLVDLLEDTTIIGSLQMLMYENWESIDCMSLKMQLLECVLDRLSEMDISHAFQWIIDESIICGCEAVLHISFIEKARYSSNSDKLILSRYALESISTEYWSESDLTEYKAVLLKELGGPK